MPQALSLLTRSSFFRRFGFTVGAHFGPHEALILGSQVLFQCSSCAHAGRFGDLATTRPHGP